MGFAQRDRQWFEMGDSTRARHAASLWIPLHVSEDNHEGTFGHPEHWSDYNGISTFAVSLKDREAAEEIEWSDAASHSSPFSYKDKYYSSEIVLTDDETPIGIRIALIQSFEGEEGERWFLNQDLVLALGLRREQDSWVRPVEGYVEVAQLRRNGSGTPVGLFIRPEYLRDYLAARNMALRILQLRQRRGTARADRTFGWETEKYSQERDGGAFIGSAWPVGGESVMVLRVGRTDKWGEDELPEMGPPSDENTTSEKTEFNRPQHGLYAVEGDFRRSEWLEPAPLSRRVRHDHVPSGVSFIVDGEGTRLSSDLLNDEEVGKWLWFKPAIVSELLSRRGSRIRWYTCFTAGIQLAAGPYVHFGLNVKGLIVVYAYDVARLAEWQRTIWAGFNVSPDGGLPSELEQAQVAGDPANTRAPEEWFGRALEALEQASTARWGWSLFRQHSGTEDILSSIHRYRALDEAGFLALAKDIARLTADRIDSTRLRSVVSLGKGENLGSLKLLERSLTTFVSQERAREALSVLVGVYELRLGDAHLPSNKLSEAFELANVPTNEPTIFRAAHLVHNVVAALFEIAEIIAPVDR